jgi:hypothetical protein
MRTLGLLVLAVAGVSWLAQKLLSLGREQGQEATAPGGGAAGPHEDGGASVPKRGALRPKTVRLERGQVVANENLEPGDLVALKPEHVSALRRREPDRAATIEEATVYLPWGVFWSFPQGRPLWFVPGGDA